MDLCKNRSWADLMIHLQHNRKGYAEFNIANVDQFFWLRMHDQNGKTYRCFYHIFR